MFKRPPDVPPELWSRFVRGYWLVVVVVSLAAFVAGLAWSLAHPMGEPACECPDPGSRGAR